MHTYIRGRHPVPWRAYMCSFLVLSDHYHACTPFRFCSTFSVISLFSHFCWQILLDSWQLYSTALRCCQMAMSVLTSLIKPCNVYVASALILWHTTFNQLMLNPCQLFTLHASRVIPNPDSVWIERIFWGGYITRFPNWVSVFTHILIKLNADFNQG